MPDTEPTFGWRIPLGTDIFKVGFQGIRDLAADIAASFSKIQNPLVQLRQNVSLGGTVGAGAWSSVLFDTAELDTAGFNAARTGGTSDSRWTCPTGKAGTYEVQGSWGPANAVDQSVYGARITKNGTEVKGTGNLIGASGTATVTPTSKIMYITLAVGDYLEFQTYGSSSYSHRNTADGFATVLTLKRVR